MPILSKPALSRASSSSSSSCKARRAQVTAISVVALALAQTTLSQRAYIPDASDVHSFSVDFQDPVALHVTATSNYQIDSDVGEAEWAQLIPPGPKGHLVYVKDDSSDLANASDVRPYTVALFHQLKCLDVIRRQYLLPLLPPSTSGSGLGEGDDEVNRTPAVRPIVRHCMNYIRQAVLCCPMLWLESTKNVLGTASRSYDAVCHDWEAVYAAASRNRASFSTDNGIQ